MSIPRTGDAVNRSEQTEAMLLSVKGLRGLGPNGHGMTAKDLRHVTACAQKLAAARREFEDAIMAARASGETYRDIGEAAGMSHNAVFKIVNARRM